MLERGSRTIILEDEYSLPLKMVERTEHALASMRNFIEMCETKLPQQQEELLALKKSIDTVGGSLRLTRQSGSTDDQKKNLIAELNRLRRLFAEKKEIFSERLQEYDTSIERHNEIVDLNELRVLLDESFDKEIAAFVKYLQETLGFDGKGDVQPPQMGNFGERLVGGILIADKTNRALGGKPILSDKDDRTSK